MNIKKETLSNAWIRRYHAAQHDAVALVCFPHAGGSATYYFKVSAELAPSIEVLAVQYPGRQDRRADPCIDDIEQLAEAVFAELKPKASRRMALFGHSMGATIAFEVAQRMEQRLGAAPLRLFVSGRRGPLRHREESVHQRDDAGIIAELRRLSGTDDQLLVDDELISMILPAIRADYRAVESYRWRPSPKLTCPITVLVGDNDPRTTLDEARAWCEHTDGDFDLQVYPGGHFYLNRESARVTALIAERLLPAGSVPRAASPQR
jgi:surfactin synthase thioesterase subunit